MVSASDEPAAKRRKLRKGTHSCQECRKRKVKCIFTSADEDVCLICTRRGTKCTSQFDDAEIDASRVEISHNPLGSCAGGQSGAWSCTNTDLNHRNTATSTEAHYVTPISDFHTPCGIGQCSNATARDESDHFRSNISQINPQLQQDCWRISNDTPLWPPPIFAELWEQLLSALPCKEDIEILSRNVSHVSAICYQSDYKAHNSSSEKLPTDMTPISSLLNPEKHPILLAKQMLLFAGALQHLSPKETMPNLSRHHHETMKRLAEAAIKLVNMDDALLGTLEGLENLIFEFFYHIDCGNIRRAWITTRRAVTVAQMLGLHRPGHYRFTRLVHDSDLEPEIMWSTIVSMERMLSLLLGLPTSTDHMKLSSQRLNSDSGTEQNVSTLVGSIAGKILERNQLDSAHQAMVLTREIDQEIILEGERMPSKFWRPLSFTKAEKDSWEALMETRRAFGHMCYYSMVVQLHLPYMLSSQDASQRVYSKIACVNASREILTRQIELRGFNAISAACRMSDFLALIAGLALMLGHLTSHYGSESGHLLAHQRLGDRGTVERALISIDPNPLLPNDLLANQCAIVLRDLLKIEETAARKHSVRARQKSGQEQGEESQRDILIMRVPYLGSIQISQEGVKPLPSAAQKDTEGDSEGVTIGGIGSLLIRNVESRMSCGEVSLPKDATVPVTSHSALNNASQSQSDSSRGATLSDESASNLFFPDPAATFDDWIFQGVDTAFIESLMSGSALPFSDTLDGEGWDVNIGS